MITPMVTSMVTPMVSSIIQTEGVPAPTDYVAYWSMDDAQVSGNTLLDLSGNGHTATMVNTPTTGVAGAINEAVLFALATNEHATVVDHPDFRPADFTIIIRIKSTTANGRVFSNSVRFGGLNQWGWGAGIASDGRPFLNLYDGTNGSSAALSAIEAAGGGATDLNSGAFHHLALSLNETTGIIKITADGVLVHTESGATGLTKYAASQGIRIGCQLSDVEFSFYDGTQDELKFFQRELSLAEIQADKALAT